MNCAMTTAEPHDTIRTAGSIDCYGPMPLPVVSIGLRNRPGELRGVCT